MLPAVRLAFCFALAALVAPGALGQEQEQAPANATTSAAPDPLQLDDEIGCDGTTLISAIMMQPELSTLRQALYWAGLQARLNDPRVNVTLFAPTDAAFAAFAADSNITLDALLNDPNLLRHLLLYHLVPEPLDPATLAATPVMDTTWQGAQVFVPQPYQGAVSGLSGTEARVERRVRVCGSYMYSIAYVLLPGPSLSSLPPFAELVPGPPPPPPCDANGTAVGALRANATLKVTLQAVQTAGLEALLSDTTSNLTLFAPIDAAWVEAATRLQLADPTDILSLDSDKLKTILTAHVVPRRLTAAKLRTVPLLYTSAAGPAAGPLFVGGPPSAEAGPITVQTPTTDAVVLVEEAPGAGCGHVVHVIDKVLLPESLLPGASQGASEEGAAQQDEGAVEQKGAEPVPDQGAESKSK